MLNNEKEDREFRHPTKRSSGGFKLTQGTYASHSVPVRLYPVTLCKVVWRSVAQNVQLYKTFDFQKSPEKEDLSGRQEMCEGIWREAQAYPLFLGYGAEIELPQCFENWSVRHFTS